MPMNLKQIIKSKLFEVEQPQSQGEKNFKALHKAVDHVNLVPGVTDQDHVFNGSTKPYDNKYPNSYKPGEDRTAYDKTLKLDNKETDNGYETANVKEDIEDIEEKNWIQNAIKKPGTLTMAAKKAGMTNAEYEKKHMHDSGKVGKRARLAMTLKNLHHKEEVETTDEAFSSSNLDAFHRKQKMYKMAGNKSVQNGIPTHIIHVHASKDGGPVEVHKEKIQAKDKHKAMTDAQFKYSPKKGYKISDTKYKGAMKEEVELLDEAAWTEKNLPAGNYNQGGHTEKGDLHHIEVHPEVLKKHGISHQVSHAGEYGTTHHFEHPSHGKVAVYQSDLNKKTGNPIMSVRTYGAQGAKPVAHKFAKKLSGNMMHSYNESVNEDYDDTPEEVSMVRTELKAMIVSAQDLLDHMPSNMHIEPWVQSKIAVAKSMVAGVHDYMLYSNDAGIPADQRIVPTMSNPFSTGTNEEVVDEALGTIKNIKAASMKGYMDSRKSQRPLTDKQKKIDLNHNNKVDGKDLAKLRSMKKEDTDLDEKLSPEQLKKFAKLAPPYNKITHADKIAAVKKKETGQKVLPEASMLGSECTKCGDGHYKEMDGKMCCDACGATAKAEVKEASMIKSHAMKNAKETMHKLNPKMKHSSDDKMKTSKKHMNMEEVSLSAEEIDLIDSIMNSTEE